MSGKLKLFQSGDTLYMSGLHDAYANLKQALDNSRVTGTAELTCVSPDNTIKKTVIIDEAHLKDVGIKEIVSQDDAVKAHHALSDCLSVPDLQGDDLDYWTAISLHLTPLRRNGKVYVEDREFSPSANPSLCEKLQQEQNIEFSTAGRGRWRAEHPRIAFLSPLFSDISKENAMCRALVASQFGLLIRYPNDPERSREFAQKEFDVMGID